jgi:23S rRNA (cytidine1920-2'-O)/16S rRNA (cytidine1409-2'-O)-methyltransferase
MRVDKELHLRGFAKSRTAASELIAQGKVAVNGTIPVKSSQLVSPDDVITLTGGALRYVSRGGLKLEHALGVFGLDITEAVCLDVGASTGGFTDCMLQHGAKRVYAVDVGTSQLAASLWENERVVSMEQCDIRTAEIAEKIGFCTVDVSFISVKLILPELKRFLQPETSSAVLLIKPQFELGRKHKGVITDRKVQDKIVADVADFAENTGFRVKDVVDSPILGKSGNREFLMWVKL